MNQEVMKLYQEHKVNPLGGCLPLLLQMPIWFALYATLQTSVELYREPFLWVNDLTAYDPFYILPLAMGVSSFVMQKISPQPADNTQAKMMLYFMPGLLHRHHAEAAGRPDALHLREQPALHRAAAVDHAQGPQGHRPPRPS